MSGTVVLGTIDAIEQIGCGHDSLSIIRHGQDCLIPFRRCRGGITLQGEFDCTLTAAPGGPVTAPWPFPIRLIRLDRTIGRLTLEDVQGTRLVWRLRFQARPGLGRRQA